MVTPNKAEKSPEDSDYSVPCRLVVESEENQGMIYPLREKSISIGRGPQNTIQVIDTRMSRIHARLDREPGGWVVRDLQSKNGVQVNGVPISGVVKLSPGDQVQVGNSVFVFETDVVEQEQVGRHDSSVKLVDNAEDDLEPSHVMALPTHAEEREWTNVQSVPERDDERLKSIYQIGNLIQTILDLDDLLNKVMEIVCQVLRPTQACIMLYDKKEKALVPKVVRRPPNSTDDIHISGSVIHQAMDDRVAVLMGDGQSDLRFSRSDSVIIQQIHSAMCAPLISKGEVLGALYLDIRGVGRHYTNSDLQWAAGVAGQAALAITISLLHTEMIAKHEQERDIQIARTIQMNLLPKTMPRIKGFDFGGLSRPARTVGGDYFDIIELEGGDCALVVADVSGKGVPAALLLASFRSAVRMEARNLKREGLVDAVERLNEIICQDATNNMFITMVLAYFEPGERRLTYCNAGHVYPLLRHPDGRIEQLEAGGSFLGIMPGMTFESGTATLPEGSITAFITDGVSDTQNAEGELFGQDRLLSFLHQHQDLPAQEFCNRLEKAVEDFQGATEQFDDLTVMALKATVAGAS